MRKDWLYIFLCAVTTLTGIVLSDASRAQSDPPRSTAEAIPSPVGLIVTISGMVKIERTAPVIMLARLHPDGSAPETKAGDPVYQGDVITTGPDSRAGIRFIDGTAFNVSSNARMELNEFIFNPNSKANSSLITLSKGAFTFVAGRVAKTGKMEVDTPVATMGIRGTTPRVEIRENGSVAFSTLIEDNKGRATEQRRDTQENPPVPPPAQRKAKGKSTPPRFAKDRDRHIDINSTICRGC